MDPIQHIQFMNHQLVSQAVLSTLTGYLDWINIQHIFRNNGDLLQTLCLLLSNRHLQLHAAECLLLIVSRKVNSSVIILP